MNIFVSFQKDGEVENFLRKPEVLKLKRSHKLVISRNDPLVIFKELSKQEFSTVETLAKESGGKITESQKYEALKF